MGGHLDVYPKQGQYEKSGCAIPTHCTTSAYTASELNRANHAHMGETCPKAQPALLERNDGGALAMNAPPLPFLEGRLGCRLGCRSGCRLGCGVRGVQPASRGKAPWRAAASTVQVVPACHVSPMFHLCFTYMWPMCGLCLAYVWPMFGLCVAYVWPCFIPPRAPCSMCAG